MQYSGLYQSINPCHAVGVRPLCPCCGGGERRKGYRHTKAASHKHNRKATRNNNRTSYDKRTRTLARPDKYEKLS